MAALFRGNTGHGCYFISSSPFQKRNILQSDRMQHLFIDVLFHYRLQEKFLLHEFVIMPDYFSSPSYANSHSGASYAIDKRRVLISREARTRLRA
jgi:hypothetical protein